MKKTLLSILVLVFIAGIVLGQSIESQIRKFAEREYPNDSKMQDYVYNKQISAYRYMLTVNDAEVKRIALFLSSEKEPIY